MTILLSAKLIVTKIKKKQKAVAKGAEQETPFPFLQFTGAVLLVSLIPLFLDNRRDKV